jgi:DNA-binding transcriptional ArsR family regulator
MALAVASERGLSRTDLFRLLADEDRLRLLALTAEDALTVSELAELLGESQPQVSKKAGPLRDAGLLDTRRDGARVYLSFRASDDAVIAAALDEGRTLIAADGSLSRVGLVIAAREDAGRRFFEQSETRPVVVVDTPSLAPSVFALSLLLDDRALALDVGTGDGALLDVLCPAFERVVAIDRSEARIAEAQARARAHGYLNASLFVADVDDVTLTERMERTGHASCAFVVRVLHHQARPQEKLRAIARLMKKGARLVVVDYLPHDDEGMREKGDVRLGFAPEELRALAHAAGFVDVTTALVPRALIPHDAPDGHLHWQVMTARVPS